MQQGKPVRKTSSLHLEAVIDEGILPEPLNARHASGHKKVKISFR
jgi:hypothetical protein